MPKAVYSIAKGLYQLAGAGFQIEGPVTVITGGLDVRNNITLRTHEKIGTSETSGSMLTFRGRDEPLFFHIGGNQYISSNAWYDADAGDYGQWKFATGSGAHSAFRWGFVSGGRFDLDYVDGGTKESIAAFTTSFALTSSNGSIGIGKKNADAGQSSFNAQLDLSGSTNAISLAVTGSVDIGGGAPDSYFMPPRHNNTTRDALTAIAGMMIYNTQTNKLNYYNGSAWLAVDDSAI